MSFLTHGTTIVDAILTDEGRRRVSLGNFDIVKFSLHDDEIVWDKIEQLAADGSEIGETQIINTPVFESISENTRALKYHLLTMGDSGLKHLISTLLVTQPSQGGQSQATGANAGWYVALARQSAYDSNYSNVNLPTGFIKAYDKSLIAKNSNSWIYIDHGFNDVADAPKKWDQELPSELSEGRVWVKMDTRIGRLVRPNSNGVSLEPIGLDDDYIATYFLSASPGSDTSEFFENVQAKEGASPILAARGRRIRLPVYASPDINAASNVLWNNLGGTSTNFFNSSDDALAIDTIMSVEGVTTNLNITVPIRFVKNA